MVLMKTTRKKKNSTLSMFDNEPCGKIFKKYIPSKTFLLVYKSFLFCYSVKRSFSLGFNAQNVEMCREKNVRKKNASHYNCVQC